MKFEVYSTLTLKGRRWRWRLRAANGRKVAHSGEDYHNRADAVSAVVLVKGTDAQTPIKFLDRGYAAGGVVTPRRAGKGPL